MKKLKRDDFDLITTILLAKFNWYKVLDIMTSELWSGYNPKGLADVYRIVQELISRLYKGFDNDFDSISTAGFKVGVMNDYMYLFFDSSFSHRDIKVIEDVDYKEVNVRIPITKTIRMLKIYDIINK